jgi:hypothetical protein
MSAENGNINSNTFTRWLILAMAALLLASAQYFIGDSRGRIDQNKAELIQSIGGVETRLTTQANNTQSQLEIIRSQLTASIDKNNTDMVKIMLQVHDHELHIAQLERALEELRQAKEAKDEGKRRK